MLYFKERYVSKDHSWKREKWEAFSNWLKGLGLDLETGYGYKQELLDFLEGRGLTGELEKWEESLQVNERE